MAIRLLITGFFSAIMVLSQAQQSIVSGKVTDGNGEPLVGITIYLAGTSTGTITNAAGQFTLSITSAGNYQLQFQGMGYTSYNYSLTVEAGKTYQANVVLTATTTHLDEVAVTGSSISQELKRQPITADAINTSPLQSESSDAAMVIDRANGVRVRQSGGLGSATNISIQGLQGKAIRYYVDGVPLEFLGGGISMNNLPINQVERIEIYKGVMPVTIGTDALGGGINIVTRKHYKSYLDLSYQAGSFNTHRPVLNAHVQGKKGWFMGFNGFLNYSDNNYKIDVTNVDLETSKRERVTVKRFHDQYKAWYGDVQIGLSNKSWADELKYTIGFSDIYKELQHGTVIRDIPVGAANYSNQALLQYINYEKANIGEKLGIVINGSFVQGKLARLDSTKNYYDWHGHISSVRNSSGAELSRQPSNAEIDRTLFSNRVTLSYRLSDKHELAFSNFYGQQRRTGTDEYGIRIAGKDPLTEPAIIRKNVSGIAYTSQWLNDKMTAVLSLKHYYYAASSATITDVYATEFPVTTIHGNLPGYNLAVRYQLSDQMSVKASYERTLRIPDETELFGDFIDVGANPALKPERSNNINVSFQWEKKIRDRYFSTDFNAFYRKQSDLIFLFIPPIGLGFYKNQNDAVAYGADFLAEVQPVKSFSIQASVTYQDVRVVRASFEDKDYDGNRIPNIPWLFFNISPRYTTKKILRDDDRLQLFTYFQYINEFPFILEGRSRNDAVYVPTQQIVSTGVSYSILNDRVTATLQANNVFDKKAYDNRSIQKPGRNFNLKLRYLIN